MNRKYLPMRLAALKLVPLSPESLNYEITSLLMANGYSSTCRKYLCMCDKYNYETFLETLN